MALTTTRIESTVNSMDEIYDANFGEWIRNEENCKVVGTNLKKYLGEYKASSFITVVKWIVKDWTLRSIILFSRKLIIDDLMSLSTGAYIERIKILSGFIFTWNPIFIAEFLQATSMEFPLVRRADYYTDILSCFEEKKLSEILAHIEVKCDEELKSLIIRRVKQGVYKPGKCKWQKTCSLVDAFNLT